MPPRTRELSVAASSSASGRYLEERKDLRFQAPLEVEARVVERGSKNSLSVFLPWALAAAFAAAAGALALRARTPQTARLLTRSALLPADGSTYSFGGQPAGTAERLSGRDASRVGTAGEGRCHAALGSCACLGRLERAARDGERVLSLLVAGREVDRLRTPRVAAAGGPPLTLCDAPYGKGVNRGATRGRFCSRRATTRA